MSETKNIEWVYNGKVPESLEKYIFIMKTNKSRLEVDDKVQFHSGNFKGLTGIITKAEYGKQFEPYGLRFTVQLSNGKISYIEKAEHWHFI